MNSPENISRRWPLWLIILNTAVITVVASISLLYLLQPTFLQQPATPEPIVHQADIAHTTRMSHTTNMEHTAGMDHDQMHPSTDSERLAEVAARGAEVMPFELERTTHLFEKTAVGGLQQVFSNDNDPEQISLIQAHLQEEAQRFQQGDFDDPAQIHGDEMPGLATLRNSYEQVTVTFSTLSDGAQIVYTTDQADVLAALHAWFDAQLSDHGSHATSER